MAGGKKLHGLEENIELRQQKFVGVSDLFQESCKYIRLVLVILQLL